MEEIDNIVSFFVPNEEFDYQKKSHQVGKQLKP